MSLRYVVLHHTGYGEDHYDLMFETSPGSKLATWRSRAWPCDGSPLQPLAEHRREYLEYEGPVSNNRGRVQRVQSGTHSVLKDDPTVLEVKLENGQTLRLPRA